MKTIIAGGRDYQLTEDDFQYLFSLEITEVISGGATGADRGGELFTKEKKIPITRFIPDWNKFRKAAGMIRNKEMAKTAEQLVVFPGGNGTKHMLSEGIKNKLIVHNLMGDKLVIIYPPAELF